MLSLIKVLSKVLHRNAVFGWPKNVHCKNSRKTFFSAANNRFWDFTELEWGIRDTEGKTNEHINNPCRVGILESVEIANFGIIVILVSIYCNDPRSTVRTCSKFIWQYKVYLPVLSTARWGGFHWRPLFPGMQQYIKDMILWTNTSITTNRYRLTCQPWIIRKFSGSIRILQHLTILHWVIKSNLSGYMHMG